LEGRLLDKISEPFNIQLPERSTMEQTLDEILKVIRGNSNAIQEEDYFLDRPMLELTDSLADTKTKLWIFQGGGGGGSILKTIDEKVDNGSWQVIENTQKVIISAGMGGTMYTLAFLDADFLILRLYGNNPEARQSKYLVLCNERVAARLEWNEALEMLYAKYRNTNSTFLGVGLAVLLVILLFIVFSQ
jgi:hypothetical protein